MNQPQPQTDPACDLCWLEIPHDTSAHRRALVSHQAHCRALIAEYRARMRLVNHWQALITALDSATLDQVGSWLIDEQADLARSGDEAARWLNRQLQRMVADEQEIRADLADTAGSAAA